jgi:hypothetical protein
MDADTTTPADDLVTPEMVAMAWEALSPWSKATQAELREVLRAVAPLIAARAETLDADTRAALRWLADHELWRDVYPDGPDQPTGERRIPSQHVRAARRAIGLTAADLGYHVSQYSARGTP